VLEAVDEALTSLGETSKTAIYFHLDKSFNIKRVEIPHKIEDFASGIEKIFGMGASFLEILIMKHMHKKVGFTINLRQAEDFKFQEYVVAAKQSFLEKEARRKRKRLKKNG
jgi:hypothetical protein